MTARRLALHPLAPASGPAIAASLAVLAMIQFGATTALGQTPPAPEQVSPPPPAPAQPSADQPPPAPAYPPPPASVQPSPGYSQPGLTLAPPAGNGPVLSLFADNPRARLQMQLLSPQWTDVCVLPCNQPVNPQGVFRVAGGSIQPSSSFRLPRPDGQVTVRARTGSKVKRWVGFGLGMAGVGSAVVGGAYLSLASNTGPDTNGKNTTHDIYQATGIAELVIAAVLMAIGFPLFASQSTSVDVR